MDTISSRWGFRVFVLFLCCALWSARPFDTTNKQKCRSFPCRRLPLSICSVKLKRKFAGGRNTCGPYFEYLLSAVRIVVTLPYLMRFAVPPTAVAPPGEPSQSNRTSACRSLYMIFLGPGQHFHCPWSRTPPQSECSTVFAMAYPN